MCSFSGQTGGKKGKEQMEGEGGADREERERENEPAREKDGKKDGYEGKVHSAHDVQMTNCCSFSFFLQPTFIRILAY